jgi:hypothetical protein
MDHMSATHFFPAPLPLCPRAPVLFLPLSPGLPFVPTPVPPNGQFIPHSEFRTPH